MFYHCPVCGYSQMQFPPTDNNICPSCGIEFGYDDFSRTHQLLRNEWLARGAHWFSSTTYPPFLWNGFRQVVEAGLPFDVSAPPSNSESFPILVHGFKQADLQVQVS